MDRADASQRAVAGSKAVALLRALRPLQWVKNGLVFLPFVFAIDVAWSVDNLSPVPELLLRLVVVAVAFCGLSSAVYLINDILDRRHPVKRHRSIASGVIGVPTAVVVVAVLVAAGLAALTALDLMLGLVALIYLSINVAYSAGMKRIVLLDAFAVTSGYVVRAVAGAVAINVTPSPWLYATTAAGALFIVLGRRYAEARLAGDQGPEQRPVLAGYSGTFINQLLTISAAAAWLSYTLYTVEAENLPVNNTMLFTLPLVTFGLFRYLYLLNTSERAEAPEQLIIRDLPLVASVIGWVAVSALVLILNS